MLTGNFINPGVIETIYFGGGTPSLLSVNQLASIIQSIHKKFPVSAGAEVTLEANPDDINTRVLHEWQNVGINRLSVGIQSFDDKELRWMNRAHTSQQSLECIDDILLAGFTNFSADLIYGSPLSTNESLQYNTEIIFNKNIPHVSCYALTVEPKTRLHTMIKKHLSKPVSADTQAWQFSLLVDWMQNAGYEQYEISNFAKPGFRSRHNSSYWQGIPYYGFGPSAHSFNGRTRRWNLPNNALYIQSIQNNTIPYEEEELTEVQHYNEYVMTALRTREGISIEKVKNDFGDYSEKLLAGVKKYIQHNLMTCSNEHLTLTNKGKFLADGIAADLFV